MNVPKIISNNINTIKITKKAGLKRQQKATVPFVNIPLVTYIIQNLQDFLKEIELKSLNGEYLRPEVEQNYKIIKHLVNERIIDFDRAWEAPSFYNRTLTQDAYKKIVDSIANSRKLGDTDKKELIDTLSRANHNSYKPVFQGELSCNISEKHDPSFTETDSPTFSPEFQAELDEIKSINTDMAPDMEEYLAKPSEDVVEGLMSDIMAELPEGFCVDEDLYSSLLKMSKEALGFLE